MTPFEITRLGFDAEEVNAWSLLDRRNINWPVVYVLDSAGSGPARISATQQLSEVYVGESLNAAARMRQHLASPDKQTLRTIRVIVDETFNKSVCLDLESYLIRLFAGDGSFQVLNRNDGIVEADYFDRASYHDTFSTVFEQLRADGVFSRSIPEIENSDLFKLSPFKALTQDQAIAVEGILEGLFEDLESGSKSSIVIQGDPGTGKTVVGIYLLKLLADIANAQPGDDLDSDSLFSDFFVDGHPELLAGMKFGLVIPQQSLRESVKKVFRRTPGLRPNMVLTAFEVGESADQYDLLVVDETHRLNQRANQPSGVQNKRFKQITEQLFGFDDLTKTQLDWIRAKSSHQIFLVDAAQSVRPADLPPETLQELTELASTSDRHYRLATQMRVRAGEDYVGYVRRILGAAPLGEALPTRRESFGEYDFRLFDSVAEMRDEIRSKDAEHGLSRLLAGYAWEWKSKNDRSAIDIDVDGVTLRWNSTQVDWIASPTSLDEVGSIHTVQGYDLNYAGVIIGPDLRFDPVADRLFVDRDSYFDAKGKENNPTLGRIYTDDDLLRYVKNVYAVLLTRGIRGTYLYVSDAALRKHLRRFVPESSPRKDKLSKRPLRVGH